MGSFLETLSSHNGEILSGLGFDFPIIDPSMLASIEI